MGTTLVGNRMFASQVIAGVDVVVAGIWVPAGSMIRSVTGYVVFEAAVERGLNEIGLGAVAAYVLPVQDPDTSGSMNTTWDRLVPKDGSSEVLDLDTGNADAAKFWEPGGQSWETVFEVGVQPRKLMQKHFMSSMGHNAIAVNRDPETTFDYEYIGGATIPVKAVGPMFVDGPALLAVAVASPLTTLTSATAAIAAITEPEWAQLQYIDEVLERAYLHLLGLTETGAETPFEEATALLKTHLDPFVLEVSGGIFQPTTWNVIGEMRFEVEVQGSLPRGKPINLGA